MNIDFVEARQLFQAADSATEMAKHHDTEGSRIKRLVGRLLHHGTDSNSSEGGFGTPSWISSHVQKSQVSASCRSSNRPDANISLELWNAAYDTLRDDLGSSGLVTAYESIVSQELPHGHAISGINSSFGDCSDQERLKLITFIADAGLHKPQAPDTYQAHNSARMLLEWSKGTIKSVWTEYPSAAIAWSGICILTPLMLDPVMKVEAMRSGALHVLDRIPWYMYVSELLLPSSWKEDGDFRRQRSQTREDLIRLYRKVLEFEMNCVCAAASTWNNAAKNVVDWNGLGSLVDAIQDAGGHISEHMERFATDAVKGRLLKSLDDSDALDPHQALAVGNRGMRHGQSAKVNAPARRQPASQPASIAHCPLSSPHVISLFDMRIIKPSWLGHSSEQKDFEVYSCHVSPDGKRLATAGGDGHVRIWSTEAIYNAQDPGYSKPRQLCHMSHHLGTIHSVRFSPNGRYLASGADDKLICVYHLDKGPPTATFGTNDPPPVENWKTYKRLIGHDNDVQDLAWSYDSSLLVSVGLDSKVVVWSGHTFEKLKSLPAHQSHVKGITFDPANKFFATASDDRTIKIFRFTPPAPNATQHDMINNFVLETTISSPFKSSPLTTYFRRCSWSPDGNHIAAANAVNGPVSSVAIIERTRWDSEINLIGHEAPTEVCMFSPRLFHTVKPGQNGAANGQGGQLVTVIASAGQDKTLSIWNTNTSRPVVILQDLSGKSISDLAWAPDGQTLFASSLDGSVIVAKFGEGELGWVAQPEENAKALQKYGASRKGMGIAEDVEGLMLENHSKAGESRAVQSRMGALMGDFQPESAKESTPATHASKADSSTTAPEAKPATNGSAEPDKPQEETADKTAERVRELKSRVTVGKDGRKRVAPLLVSSSGTGQSSLPQTQLVGSTTTKSTQNDAPQTILDLTKPFDGLPKGGIVSMLLGNKRRAVATDAEDDEEPAAKRVAGGPTAILTNGADGVEPSALAPVDHGVVPTPEFLRPAVLNPSISFAQVRLAVPKIRSHILRPLERGILQAECSLEDASKPPENIILEAKNDPSPRDPSHVTVTKRGVLVWQEFLPRAVILVTANKNLWAVACEDGTVHVWTPAGRRLLNPVIVESQPVILECRDYWLLVITAVGLVHVWDLRTQSSPHPPVSLGPILDIATTSLNQHTATPGPGITSAHLNTTGHIVMTLTNGDGYYYARDMYTWQRLSESWWAVGSQYWNSNDSSISALQSTAVGANSKDGKDKDGTAATVSSGIIPFLERHTTNEFLLKGRAYALQRIIKTVMQRSEGEGLESSVSIAHLENRIAGALQLGAREEFRLYLFMYAKRLGAEGAREKVEELLNSLVGGVLEEEGKEHDGGRGWYSKEDELCGWDRQELLKGVVLILGKYRELQRLTAQYARVLDLNLEDGSADVDSMDVES